MQKTITLFLGVLPLFLVAQPETFNWYFGNERGLNFSSGSPVPLTDGVMNTPEGCASFSDANGNLLFYTNGGGRDPIASGGQPTGRIWNRNHEVMYDMGNTEGGGLSARQSSIVIPKPGDANNYLLFTMEEVEFNLGGPVIGQPQGRGLSLFEIDMDLNGGLGEVVVADERIYVPAYEALSATVHGNEDAYWIIIFEANENVNQLVSIFVDGQGIGFEDFNPQIVDFLTPLEGMLKVSPAGNWVAVYDYIFSFDNETGDFSGVPDFTITGMEDGSFSPDSRYYYYWKNTGSNKLLARIDLESDNVEDSEEILLTLPGAAATGQFQLASNGNIYFVHNGFGTSALEYYLGEIVCPNSSTPSVTEVVFTYDHPVENVAINEYYGLPNFPDHLFRSPDPALSTETLRLCPDQLLTLRPRVEGVSYAWSDGSTADSLVISAIGTYSVSITDACGEVIVDEKEVLERDLPVVVLDSLPPAQLCVGESFDLTVLPERFETILWSTGDTTETITVTETGNYTVTMTNVCGSTSEEIAIEFLGVPALTLTTEPSGGICPGETAQLMASAMDAVTLSWNTGETTSDIIVTEPGTYSVTADNGCFSASDSTELNVLPLPTVGITADFPTDSLCLGEEELLLTATTTNADEVSWSRMESDVILFLSAEEAISVVENATYTVAASNACGSVTSDIVVDVFSDCAEDCELSIPEIFSPNNDGRNDRFGAFTNCTPLDYQLVVYSRWGKEVFTTSNPTEFWLGEFSGSAAPSDAYLYQLQYRFSPVETLVTKRGSLTLVR
ncbi:MAG: gliding motility-associated C-terminal domain-containing protein [Bacteroidota bacterium]